MSINGAMVWNARASSHAATDGCASRIRSNNVVPLRACPPKNASGGTAARASGGNDLPQTVSTFFGKARVLRTARSRRSSKTLVASARLRVCAASRLALPIWPIASSKRSVRSRIRANSRWQKYRTCPSRGFDTSMSPNRCSASANLFSRRYKCADRYRAPSLVESSLRHLSTATRASSTLLVRDKKEARFSWISRFPGSNSAAWNANSRAFANTQIFPYSPDSRESSFAVLGSSVRSFSHARSAKSNSPASAATPPYSSQKPLCEHSFANSA